MHCSSFLRKIFDIFVHLSSNHIGCISPWIIDHPRNLRENGDGSGVPVWWLGRELDLFSACCYLGIPGPCMLLGRFSGGAVLRPHPFQIIILNSWSVGMHSWRIRIIPQMLCLIPRTWKLPDTTMSMMRTMMNNGSRKFHGQRRNRRATWAGNYWQGLFLEVPHHSLRYRGLFR